LPILEYNCEIWFSKKKVLDIEKIHLRFLKCILGVRTQTSTVALLGDTGRYPLLVRQQVSAVKYLQRFETISCPPLVRACYEIQKQLHTSGAPCWYNRLFDVLRDNGANDLNNLHIIPSKLFTNAQINLFDEINNNDKHPKLRTYRTFKRDMRIEPYLILGLPKSFHCSIARFRLSSHNLKIELGRHKRPYVPPEQRICENCSLQQIEDEIHCLMVCPKWNEIRIPLLEVSFEHIPNFTVLSRDKQFHEILTHKSFEVNHTLGQFLKRALRTDT